MVDIIGRAKVIAETVIDERQAKTAGEKAGKKAADGVADGGKQAGEKFGDNFEGTAGGKLSKVGLGLGIAAGAAIATGIGQSLQRDATGKRFAASLGLDAADAAELNKAASQIYKEAWGASFEDVQRGVAATKSSFEGLAGDELTDAARAAQIFADVFEVDVVEAAGAASVAVKQGLAKDAVEAFDLMTVAAQNVPLQFRDELREAITEYSSFFADLGLSGAEAFGILAANADKGAYGIDKTGDAIKEFSILATESTPPVLDAFEKIGLDAETMQTKIATGGTVARDAFLQIVDALAEIDDPLAQRQAALALFGTPLEDLSQETLPVFIQALADGDEALKNFEGATEQTGAVASETFTVKAQGWGRSLNVNLGETIDRISDAWEGMGPIIDDWASNIGNAIGDAIDWIEKYIRQVARIPEAPGFEDSGEGSGFFNSAPGRAVGGPASGLIKVGERGPELLEVPNGSYVHSAVNSQRIAGDAARSGNTFNITHMGSAAGLVRELDWWDQYGRAGA